MRSCRKVNCYTGHLNVIVFRYLKSHSAAPSGHVLDKLEIKVLHNMMETYKNERLKELKSSIQEAQNESRILSREEVEMTLRQNGLTMVADHLKETLKRGINFAALYRYLQLYSVLQYRMCDWVLKSIITNNQYFWW
jgi:hypothetical protein